MKRPPRHQLCPTRPETLELRRLLAASAFALDAATYNISEAQGTLYFYIDRTGDSSTTETVDYATGDGTAVAGVDYTNTHGTATFAPGQNSMPFPVSLIDSGVSATPTKSFTVTLSHPTGGATLGTPSTATAAIEEPIATTGTTTTVTAGTNGSGTPDTNTFNFGSYATFEATVDRTHLGVGSPTGTLTFTVDGVARAPITLPSDPIGQLATASFYTNTLSVGRHTITASYSGDASATASMGSKTITVAQATTASLVKSSQVALAGQPLTLTLQVKATDPAAGTPTGTVTFDIYQSIFAGGTDVPNPIIATGTATLVPSATPGLATATYVYATSAQDAGVHAVIASYGGDATFAPDQGFTTAVVAHDATTTTLAASSSPSVAGQPVTLTATVTAAGTTAPLVGYNSGAVGYVPATVTFTIDGVAQTPVPLVATPNTSQQGTATFATGPLTAGPHTITATFSDGSNYLNADSGATLVLQTLPETVTPTPTPTPTPLASTVGFSTSASGRAVTVGQPFVLVANAAASTTSAGVATGTVELLDGTTLVGLLSLDAQGVAVFYLPTLAAGSHQFTVIYLGDAHYAASSATGNPITVADTTPPTVAGVARAGSAKVATATVTISFVGPLAAPGAQTAGNYRVTTAGGQSIRVRSAVYDASANSVTLHLGGRLAVRSTYRLRIAGGAPSGVAGANGMFLAGAGQAGTNYQGTIPRATATTKQAKVQATATPPRAHLAAQHHAAARTAHARSARSNAS